MTTNQPRLSTRLMQAQILVVGVGTLTLIFAALLIAPRLFTDHLIEAGLSDADVSRHATEAFASSFAIAVLIATVTALLTAGGISLFMVRRVSRPVEDLARSAEAVAAGQYNVTVPTAPFSRELFQLSASFAHMAERLAEFDTTRSRMIDDLAHELRTPLATLEAYIDGMEDDVLSADTATFATMRMQVDRLRRLASDLRDSSKTSADGPGIIFETIDLRDVTRETIAAVVPRFDSHHVDLDYSEGPDPILIRGDSIRLQQVFTNLLNNALRHTPPDGAVSVSVVGLGSTTQVLVADNGEGIPREHLRRIFERLYRGDPARDTSEGEGSGLGLTIARALVSGHGGSLDVFSEGLGKGSLFRLQLPQIQQSQVDSPI